MNRNIYCLLLLIVAILQGCQQKEEIGVNPYAGGKEPLGIAFTSYRAEPTTGLPGEVIEVKVRGLKAHENKFKVMLSEVPAELVALSDSTLSFRIPQEVSSGALTIELNEQLFVGPRVGVEGKASVDADYKIVNGFNSQVTQLMANSGGVIAVGSFTDFENEATGAEYRAGIHFINSLGQSATTMDFRRRASGGISSIAKLPNGQFIVGGYLSKFSNRAVGGIARLNANGSLDTVTVSVINPDMDTKPLNGLDTVSAFNGGFSGGVTKVFPMADNGVLVVGSFSSHWKIDYSYSSRENRRYITTRVKNVARLKPDGSLDSTFNIGNSGLNGIIMDVVQLKDGRVVIAGAFTNYNGKSVPNIVCIKPDGSVDESFTAAGGPNREITSMTYNPTVDQVVVAGSFSNFAGKATTGVVVLNSSGTIDPTFVLGDLGGEIPSYAYKLNNGRVLVTGSFSKYNNVGRNGILILEANGTAKQEYNNLGRFSGIPLTLLETTSSLGNPAILLGGFIFSVDGKSVGNIVKIELKN